MWKNKKIISLIQWNGLELLSNKICHESNCWPILIIPFNLSVFTNFRFDWILVHVTRHHVANKMLWLKSRPKNNVDIWSKKPNISSDMLLGCFSDWMWFWCWQFSNKANILTFYELQIIDYIFCLIFISKTVIYFPNILLNEWCFERTRMPISGQLKQLRRLYPPTIYINFKRMRTQATDEI